MDAGVLAAPAGSRKPLSSSSPVLPTTSKGPLRLPSASVLCWRCTARRSLRLGVLPGDAKPEKASFAGQGSPTARRHAAWRPARAQLDENESRSPAGFSTRTPTTAEDAPPASGRNAPKGPGQGFGRAQVQAATKGTGAGREAKATPKERVQAATKTASKPPPAQRAPSLGEAVATPKVKVTPKVIRRAAPERPLLGKELASEQEQQTETAIVLSLGLIFGIVLLEGLFLAASGFLPEEWDTFALDNVYPVFSPTVGLFLLIASGYGLFKFLSGKGS